MSDGIDENSAILPDDPEDSIRLGLGSTHDPSDRSYTLATWSVLDETVTNLDNKISQQIRPNNTNPTAFIIRDIVDQGGVGEVWSAVQSSLGRTVAVKKIRSDVFRKSGGNDSTDNLRRAIMLRRFQDEAIITARLDHPNIVPVYDLGQDENGNPLLAMKLVRGEPWSRRIKREFKELDPQVFLSRNLPILQKMMQAVAFAHDRGIVHRDLKPSQVMLGEYGEVILIDWGLAMTIGETIDSTSIHDLEKEYLQYLPNPATASNPSGTPALMAPEQTFKNAKNISHLTDVYLIGGTLYYLLTGKYPHESLSSAISMKLAAAGIVVSPSVVNKDRIIPGDLELIAMKALSFEQKDRYQSVKEMLAAVEDHLSGESRRHESTQLLTEAETKLNSIPQFGVTIGEGDLVTKISDQVNIGAVYTTLSEIDALIDRALELWPKNPGLFTMRDRVAITFSSLSALLGDLRFARHMLASIANKEARGIVYTVIDAAEEEARKQARSRKAALTGVAVLLVLLMAGGIKYTYDQQVAYVKLTEERDATEMARRDAVAQREIAEAARRNARTEQYFSTIAFADSDSDLGRYNKVQKILSADLPSEFRNWEWGHLYSRTMASRMLLSAVTEEENNLHATFSRDGTKIYSGDRLGNLKEYSRETGELLRRVKIHDGGLWYISQTTDGKTIVTSGFDETGAIVDVDTFQVRHRLLGHENLLRGNAISPDNKRILTSSRDKTARVWDLETGELLRTFKDYSSGGYDVDYSPDGRYHVVAAGPEFSIRNAETGVLLGRSPIHPENILSISFSPDGTKILTSCTDRNARVFDAETLEEMLLIENKTSWLMTAEFSPDGSLIATGDDQGMCRIWDAKTGNKVHEFYTRPRLFQVDFSPDGKQILTGSSPAVQLWDLDRIPASDGLFRLAPEFAEEKVMEPLVVDYVFAIPLESSGAWRGYDYYFRDPENLNNRYQYVWNGQSISINSFYTTWSPDGTKRLRVPFSDYGAILEDGVTGEFIQTLPQEDIFYVRWSPSGDRFVTGTTKGLWTLWDAETIEPVSNLGDAVPIPEGQPSRIPGMVEFSSQGTDLIYGNIFGDVVLFDAITGEERIVYTGANPETVFCVAMTDDHSLVAAGRLSGRIDIWNGITGELLHSLLGHSNFVLDLDFSSDGKRLVSTGHDDEVKLWDLENGRYVMNVFELPSRFFILGAGFLPDGRGIYCINSDGNLHIADSLPWEPKEIPGDPAAPIEQRMELYRRLSNGIPATLQDIDW